MQGRRSKLRFERSLVLMFLLGVGLTMIAGCGDDAAGSAIVRAGGGLRMRSAPDLEASRILTIPDGTTVSVRGTQGSQVKISGKQGRWTEVEYDGKSGWVFGGFLEFQAASEHRPDSKANRQEYNREDKISRLKADVSDEIFALTRIRIPPAELSEQAIDRARLGSSMKVMKRKEGSGFIVFNLSPHGGPCNHYGYAECINIIADDELQYIASDLDYKSFGEILDLSTELIRFHIVQGDGDGCSFGGAAEVTGYLPQAGRLLVQETATNSECECCETNADGAPHCPCDKYKEGKAEAFKDMDGRKINPSPEIQSLFRKTAKDH